MASSENDESDLPFRSDALAWAEIAKEAYGGNMLMPPSYMTLYLDLLDEAGWKRLVPYEGYVSWQEYKDYLVGYFQRNAADEQKPGQAGQHSAAKVDALKDAATLCLNWENKLFKGHVGDLAIDDVTLIIQIRNRAKEMIKSSGDQSVTATVTVGMECIAKEAELMVKLLECEYDTSRVVAICNNIRRSVLNLIMLQQGSESIAAAGAMVGAIKEAALFLDLLSRVTPCIVQYRTCDIMGQYIALVLTKLEEDFSCDTDAATG